MSALASPKCPNCLRNYSFSQAGLQPRILSCKHSICKQCVVKLVRVKKDGVTCPKCKVATVIPKEDKGLHTLPVNLFLVGLACTTVKQQINPFNHKLEFKPKPKDSNGNYVPTELKGGRPPCISCHRGPAECLCQQCNISLCNQCFITIHSNQAGKTHAKMSLLTDKVYGCTKHENMPREFFCQDDKEPICAKCGLTGKHKGHNILHIQEKNTELHKEVGPALAAAKETLKKLYYSEEAVEAEKLRLLKNKEVLIDHLEEKFAQFAAELQLKFLAIQESVLSVSDSQLENLGHIKSNLESNICRLTTVMEDVLPGLEDKTKVPPNLLEVISILRGASQLPWYLTDGPKEGTTIPFHSIADIPDRVNVEQPVLHTLKSSAELPEDFEEPAIDDNILKKNPLLGGEKEQKKKEKPIGPDHIRILQREGILPADLTEIREQVSSDPKAALKKTNKKQFVNVVHIRNPACFYVHRQADQARLAKMMRSLTNICESIEDLSKHIPDPIQVGTKCCCKFNDGQWYRSMVRKIPDDVAGVLSMASPQDLLQADDKDDLKVEVVYIDYGNTQWVSVAKLAKLKPKFEKEPTFAVSCALYDILPPDQKSTWPRESSEAFAAMVATQDVPLVMSTHGDKESFLQVDLHQPPNSSVIDDGPVSIRDALIFLELACFINDTPSPKSPKFFQPRRYLPPELPCSGDSVGVISSHIVDPHHFWVHEMGVMQSSLNKMMGELQEAYRKRNRADWAILCPKLGMICVAKYANDKKWYRAQITGLPGNQQVEVLYVDYGNDAVIKATLIRKITEQFLKLPVMALPCKLVDVAPKVPEDGWSENSSYHLSLNFHLKAAEIHIYNDQDDFMAVVAFVIAPEERININAMMVQSGYATGCGPASFAPEMLRPSPSVSAASKAKPSPDAKLPYHCEPSSARKKETYTAVHVSHVETPGCIYLQLATASKNGLDSLLEAMTLHYKDTEADMDHEWSEGDPCAALLAREGVWCRGEIMAFLPENNLVVLFTDYGNKEILALQNIRSLEEGFKSELPFANCCHLTGIIPAGGRDWTQTASQFLKEKLSDLDCYISQKGEEDSSSLPVDLLYELTGQEMIDRNTDDELESISELLIKEGLALRDRSKPTSKLRKKAPKKALIEKRLPDAQPAPTGEGSANDEKRLPDAQPAQTREGSANQGGGCSPSGARIKTVDSLSPHDENSAINDSGDSGIVNPDHGTMGSSPPHEGTSVDRAPSPHQTGDQGDNDNRENYPPKDVAGDSQLSGGTERSPRDVGEQVVEMKGTNLVVESEADSAQTIAAEQSSEKMRNWVDQMDEEVGGALDAPSVHANAQSSPELSPEQGRPEPSPPQTVQESSPVLEVLQSISEEPSRERGRSRSLMVPDQEPLSYLPPVLPDRGELVLAVSFVSREGLIYGLDVDKFEVLQRIMNELQGFCQSRSHPTEPLKSDQAVCAKFQLDNKWYRATVTNTFKDTVEVCYIDFGNSEVVPLEDIHIRPFKTDLPQLSLCCKLHEVTTISPENSIILAQTVTEQTCAITVKENCQQGKPVVVDMVLPTGVNVAELLLRRGLVTSTRPSPLAAPQTRGTAPQTRSRADSDNHSEEVFDEDDDFFNSGECTKNSLNHDVLREHAPVQYDPEQMVLHPSALLEDSGHYTPLPSSYRPLQFPLGWKEFLAEVPCIETPNLVYLQYSTTFRNGPYQDHELMLLYEKFAALHAEVNKLAPSLPDLIHPRQGKPCLAYYQSDKQWYRGEIISVFEGHILYCDVRFVDYGTIERLPLDKICQIPEKYLELPTQCRLCKLEGLVPPAKIPPGFPVSEDSKWPVATTNAMIQLIKNKIFLATILEDGPVPIIGLYGCEFANGGILRGPPMFLNLIEMGLADVGVGFNDYRRSETLMSSQMPQ